MPASIASWMAAMESLSSWDPQANSQPDPPIAHAPKPIGVINRSEFPSRFVFMFALFSQTKVPVEALAGRQRSFRLRSNAPAVPNHIGKSAAVRSTRHAARPIRTSLVHRGQRGKPRIAARSSLWCSDRDRFLADEITFLPLLTGPRSPVG